MTRLSALLSVVAACVALGCSDTGGSTTDGSAGTGGGTAGAGGGEVGCASVTTLEACDARGDCHAVFEDPRNCACQALGCCAQFSRCAAGDRARCMSGVALCDIVTPYCEAPYKVSYTDSCYEGCVRMAECMLTP